MSEFNGLPSSWMEVSIELLLQPLEDGRILHHGWSPQCEAEPSQFDDDWGVLKTTAIQDGLYLSEHNKRLPRSLMPRAHLEVHDGDILITCAGPRNRCGVPCLVRQTRPRLILSGKMYRFRVHKGVMDAAFMEAFLRAKHTQAAIDRMKTGISDSGLNLTHARFLRLTVPVAPINEQRRIVQTIEELFSDLDAGVAALERARANLKRYRASVLKAAVEGSLTAEWRPKHPKVEPASKLLERILKGRRHKWESDQLAKFAAAGKQPPKDLQAKYVEPTAPDATDLPELPEGWCWASVGQLLAESPQNGAYYPRSLYGTGDPIIRIDDYQQFWSRSADALQRVRAPDKDREVYGLAEHDILVNRVNSPSHLGKVVLVEAQHLPALFESNMMRLRFCNASVARYVRDYLRSVKGTLHLIANAKWAVNQASINQKDVQFAHVPLPPLEEQVQVVAEVAEKLSQIEAAGVAIDHGLLRATRLRQSILKQAFEGKLVAQDPTDEPAGELLERLRSKESASNGKDIAKLPARPRTRRAELRR